MTCTLSEEVNGKIKVPICFHVLLKILKNVCVFSAEWLEWGLMSGWPDEHEKVAI